MQEPPPPEPAAWCIEKLNGAGDYFLSTHALYQEYCGLSSTRDSSYERFEELLRSDERLYVTPGSNAPMPPPQQKALSGMGFPAQALVALASKLPSGEELNLAIRAKAVQLQHALRKAWEARPADDPEVEKRLLYLMEQAKKLCDKLESLQEESE